ncbi:MAG: DegT/DnrJ/EryC1/StrS family aminotransferase [Thermomicrobiales bacterium]
MAGAKPVYADIDPHTYCVTAETVSCADQALAAVLPVHIHGYPVDLQPICDAIPADVPIIEDACQAAGTELADGRWAGRFAWPGDFLLNQTKASPAAKAV